MTVVLLRHASAGDRNRWEGDDRLRPLDKKGRRQSEGAVELLSDVPVSVILSSPAVRCVQTVEPLARARSLVIEEREDLWEEQPGPSIALVLSLVATDAVVCSHGDNIPAVLEHLARSQGLDLGPHPDCKKGSAWVLSASAEGDRFTSARYLPPRG